jgi:2-haloacid dehalogenase
MPPTVDAGDVTRRRPAVVAFDVVETLFSLAPVEDALAPLGLDVDLFFARVLRDGFALSSAGDARAFAEVAASALAALTPSASPSAREGVLDSFARLPAQSDAAPAIARLTAAGITVVALTNGAAASTERLLAESGLAAHVERVLSVDEVAVWKPAAAPYLGMAHAVDRAPEQVALVAVHGWDVHGAGRAGLTTGWASRLEGTLATIFRPPDVVGSDLVEVIDCLLSLPPGDDDQPTSAVPGR